MHYASVIVDIPTRELASAFYYEVPAELVATAQVGCCVLVDFAHRKALGYIVDIACDLPAGTDASKVKSIDDILSEPFFDAASAELAKWIAHEYMSPLSEAIHLFVPSGAAPKLRKTADGKYHITGLKHRKREPEELPKRTYDIEDLTAGQREALDAIKTAMAARNSDTPARHSDTPLRHSDAPLRHSGLDPE
ncbi:MAG: hypothetical protein LBM21_03510, partial [Coriobacteriales bacterium]|nr:hypothetical protein [Coriobacteriales bacterium]